MWRSQTLGRGIDTIPTGEPSSAAIEAEDLNSTLSNDEGSSGEESRLTSSNGPTRKRRRERHQKISCEMCKSRKVKCDRAEPACSWCARHNRACVYLERQKPGTARNGFSLELEAKVNRIDALLQALGRRVEEHIVQDHAAASPSLASSTANNLHGDSQGGGRLTPTSLPRTSSISQARSPSLSGTTWQPGIQPQQPLMMASLEGPTQPISSPNASGFRKDPSLHSFIIDLPPHDVVYTLVDLYFKHCNTWCPILDRKTTFASFFGPTLMEEADRILLYAIVATTLRFLKDPRMTSEMRTYYHAVSKHTVQIYAMEHISVPALRALVIITLDELGTSNGPRGWNLLSLLSQSMRQLGLCEETTVFLSAEASETPHTGSVRRVAAGKPESWIEDEGRRRLYWMIYLLDRYATIATPTFDFMLDSRKVTRFLPCSYDLFSKNVPVETRAFHPSDDQQREYLVNKPENLGSFTYHCEILIILSKIHEFLKTPIDVSSAKDMAEWRNTYQTLDRSLDVDPLIDFFIDTLRNVGQHWDVASNYSKILSRLVQRGRQGDMSFAAMRRSAYDLVTLTSTARHSSLEPTSTQVTSLSELDNIDVFDFFNYPRVSNQSTANLVIRPQTMNNIQGDTTRNAVPDPEADWLAYGGSLYN
ncbi:hypothetical protein BHE90_009940 [Fusarium euwallaceae]|uniref:Zn(2)-C6 fungal-type domain-containing protein n=1 Tax=Fusarium euwallaceae TaxID=1147111 RepID=A0A430LIQ0_9HYPO|nr:hypothetical protein BHE90_009940 [Fusarium euwallaceae]